MNETGTEVPSATLPVVSLTRISSRRKQTTYPSTASRAYFSVTVEEEPRPIRFRSVWKSSLKATCQTSVAFATPAGRMIDVAERQLNVFFVLLVGESFTSV